MPRKYYPLTPSQKIHFKPIIEFGTQQVANISICMTLQAPLDFGLLKNAYSWSTKDTNACESVLQKLTKMERYGNMLFLAMTEILITKTSHGFPVMTLITAWKNGPEFRLTGTIFQ